MAQSSARETAERQALRLRELRIEISEHLGDVREGVRAFTGDTLTALAGEAGVGRKDVDMCLGKSYGRVYPGTRRTLEVVLDIPQYALDLILDEET